MKFAARLRKYFQSLRHPAPARPGGNSRRRFLQWMGLSASLPVGRILATGESDMPAALIKASYYFEDQVNVQQLLAIH